MSDLKIDKKFEEWRKLEGIKTVDDERKVRTRDMLNRCVLKPNGKKLLEECLESIKSLKDSFERLEK